MELSILNTFGVVDLHVHVGQWNDLYYAPMDIARQLLDEEGLSGIGISSLSACKKDYNMVEIIEEIEPLFVRYPGRIFHWLWLHPMAVPKKINIAMRRCPIHGLKIHPYAHNWSEKPVAMNEAFALASREELPVLVHTGNDLCCEAILYERVISEFPDVDVVLAHAKPLAQALQMAEKYKNVWLDTAFVSKESLTNAASAGLLSRFLFGSDYPITMHYGEKKYSESYKKFNGISIEDVFSSTRSFLRKNLKNDGLYGD